MDAMAGFEIFESGKYLSLETYRQSGVAVRTPVWFVAAPNDTAGPRLYVYSAADSGKGKRIRRNGKIRIAPCDIRGNVTGGWIDSRATIVGAAEFSRAMPLLNRKYWPWKGLLDLFMRFRPGARRIVIAIQMA